MTPISTPALVFGWKFDKETIIFFSYREIREKFGTLTCNRVNGRRKAFTLRSAATARRQTARKAAICLLLEDQ